KSLSPRADKLAQLARVLQCDLRYLVGEDAAPAYAEARAAYQPLREEPAAFGPAARPPASDAELPVYASREGGQAGFIVELHPIEFVR
ncbi:hypothetical protein ABTM57_20040, partial [Acinetobacter baumannii]